MAVRKIFVDPGDYVIVHVMGDEYEPKNMKGWRQSAIRPFKFGFTPTLRGLELSDPGIDIRFGGGVQKRQPQKINQETVIEIVKACVNAPKGVIPDIVYSWLPDINLYT
jgi:hypothetical protein